MRLWQRRGSTPRVRPSLLFAGTAMVLVLTGIVAWKAGTALVVTRPLARPDAILSLASREWERLPLTAQLAAENPDALVLLTLPQPATPFNCHDCAGRVDRLRQLGVDASRVRILPLTARGTQGEAIAAYAFAQRSGIRRLLVVTSPYHTRRALATFRRRFAAANLEVGVQPASATSPADPGHWWRTPYDRWYVRYEWSAVIYYAVRYGIGPFVSEGN